MPHTQTTIRLSPSDRDMIMRLRVELTVHLAAGRPGFRPPTGTDIIRAAVRRLFADVDANPKRACERAYRMLEVGEGEPGGEGY